VSQQNEGKRCQSEDTQEQEKKRRQQTRFERVSIDSSSSKQARSPPVGFFDEVKRPLFATCSDTKGQEEVEEFSHEGPVSRQDTSSRLFKRLVVVVVVVVVSERFFQPRQF
jgi:hypothetical protein